MTRKGGNSGESPQPGRSGKKKRSLPKPEELQAEFEVAPQDAPAPEPVPPKPGNRLTRLLFRPKLLILLATVLFAVFAGPRVLRLLPKPEQQDDWQITSERIHITSPPHWIPRDLAEQVARQAGLPEAMSLQDDDVVGRIAMAFAGHPWVQRVVRVEKAWPARVNVELEYRRPVAMVQVAEGLYPVDGDAVLLPPGDFSMADTRLYPMITGVAMPPQGQAGRPWGNLLVLGAARLADVLGDYWKTFRLQAIHLPRPDEHEPDVKDAILVLETRGGTRIIWGRAPGSGHPGELTAAQKIGRLERYLEEYSTFDGPDGPYEIDIRHWQEIARRRLPTSVSGRGSNPR